MMVDIDEAEVTKVQSQNDSVEDIVDFSKATEKLAHGILTIYQPSLEKVKENLNELTSKQEVLLNQIQNDNKKLQDVLEDADLNEMFATIKLYQGKLTTIKKEMVMVHDRTFKLKKRALRLQQIKQKEALGREQQREQELRREQELIGKPTTSQ
ncbi:biogenesis of lysosome-related organelles complex 1 subunit 6-like [Vespa mandarinia]|uniref:biogenesis of lysosome-related organelles complex 1 subunit 6-like n=1 Tax=Vespa mandarinia TaxID=7446 RepID=UPI001609D752|nr:biogenesis of lysosome-related organelles complex 1 subunit 6-like [Vespa mandarinia]XP_047366014.1 biogenesis of lysosome-related organelles complex 1 subunit 6-like [Vespa velutina]